MKKIIYITVLLVTGLIIFNACTSDSIEELEPYANPFSETETPMDTSVVDSFSIAGIHQNILNPSCNVLGCHDGSFEPDFRTVQSSWSTLVYHPIIKNNTQEEFQYRVVPYDKDASVLYERITNCCFVNQDDRMPQDNIGVPLNQELIDAIGKWIDDGAKDIYGEAPKFPNTQPKVAGYFAFNSTFETNYSENRVNNNWYEPFYAPYNADFQMYFLMVDDITPAKELDNVQLKLSTSMDDFSASTGIDATLFSVQQGDFWQININTTSLPKNQTIYFRIYTDDGDHDEPSESPSNSTFYLYKSYFSFFIPE